MLQEGVRGAGEPMSVGGLVAIDGCDVFKAWAGESVSDAWCCRLLLEELVIGLCSLSSSDLFLLVSMFEYLKLQKNDGR